jgi:hypothetical protein
MTTTYDTDPNIQTIAVAWASSPLGQPEREVRYGFATTSPTEPVIAFKVQPTAERVMIAAGLASGIAAAALVGVMFFADTNSAQPMVVVPGSAPQHAVVVGPSTAVPKHVVSEQSTAPSVGLNPQPEPPKPPYVVDPVLPTW